MPPEFETDNFPFVKANFFKSVTGKRKVRLIVIHSMEAAEKDSTAENVARFFAARPLSNRAPAGENR